MLYPLTGFPFDLFLGILIAFVFKPDINPLIVIAGIIFALVPGFFITPPAQVIFWVPGGAASIMVAAIILSYGLSSLVFVKNKTLLKIPDRRFLRTELIKIPTVEERQQEYLKMIGKIARTQERNNDEIIKTNTAFLLLIFFILFLINFSAVTYIYIKNPDSVKMVFQDFYNTFIMEPGKYDEWFSGIIDLAAIQFFMLDILFTLLMIFVVDRVLVYRKLRQPIIGSPLFFQLPFYSLWLYILSGVALFLTIKFNPPVLYSSIAKNVFGIFTVLYVFQGISVTWLYFQVRLLPGGSIIFFALFISSIIPQISIVVIGILLTIGLLDFWVDLRKKALHPNLMSNGA